MLFNSYGFLLVFLPLALAGFWLVSAWLGRQAGVYFLIVASGAFYAAWNPPDVWVIVISILANYGAGQLMVSQPTVTRRKFVLGAAIAANLCYLAWFKYAAFLAQNFSTLWGRPITLAHIALPLGISFFTFQQITYLVDIFRSRSHGWKFRDYVNCVTFFPHLIAGPIVHYREILPQFKDAGAYRPSWNNMAVGISLLAMGLTKKVLIADNIAPFADEVFGLSARGTVTFLDAWFGVLAFTFQIYFDFSGYSDMAIGLARMFGIVLPMNFNSPYKAASIIDFWRRWHITLSRLLRDYLYIPLGGNRKGRVRRYANLMATMLIGGLWHGAGWTFVLWGGLHGLYLGVNHAALALRRSLGLSGTRGRVWQWTARLVTFLAVVWAWVPFRAPDFAATLNVWKGLIGLNGLVLPQVQFDRFAHLLAPLHPVAGFTAEPWGPRQAAIILLLWLMVWMLPNSADVMNRARPVLETEGQLPQVLPAWMSWRPSLGWSLLLFVGTVITFVLMARPSQFVYFQF